MFTSEDFLFINQPFYAAGEKTVVFEIEECEEIDIEKFRGQTEIVAKRAITKEIERKLY